MTVKYGRVVYAFVPGHYENIAVPSGPRPVLLSYHYLKNTKAGALKELEKWRKYNQPWLMMIDSGVYTLRQKLGVSSTAAGSGVLREFTKEDWKRTKSKALEKKDMIDKYVREYIVFLKEAEGLFDVAIEMDLDYELGIKYADEYYQQIVEKIDSKKILRVWHHHERTFEDWENWVNDPAQAYLCVEGGTVLGRNEILYNRFVNLAKEKGKKVHILALTIPGFLRNVNVDTADSSTYVNGGRFATVKVPTLGEVCFSTVTDLSKQTASTNRHYKTLSSQDLEFCIEYFKSIGFTLNDALATGNEGFWKRTLMTIAYYDDYVDIPYIEKSSHEVMF